MRGLRERIDARYGSHRGLVRLWLAEIRALAGAYQPYRRIDWPAVERFVFVCQGNVCRSPYGELRARSFTPQVASFGLATTTGQPANPVALEVARERGVDLSDHRVTAVEDFDARDGDLFLIMEDRHIAPLETAMAGRLSGPPMTAMLGFWAQPRRALIYDPMDRGAAYFETCYSIMDSAIDRAYGGVSRGAAGGRRRPGRSFAAMNQRSARNGLGSRSQNT